MKKIAIISFLVVVAVVVAIGLYLNEQKKEPLSSEKIIRLGMNFGTVDDMPSLLAQKKGIFEKHGLKVELVKLSSGNDIAQAVALGRADIGIASASNFFNPIAKEAPVKIIAPYNMITTLLFVRKDSIKNIQELKGKSIGTRLTSGAGFALKTILAKEGLNIKDFKFIDIDKNLRVLSLVDKKIVDAVPDDNLRKNDYLKNGAEVLKEWQDKKYDRYETLGLVMGANKNFLDKHPEEIKEFLAAIIESKKFLHDNEDQSIKIIYDYVQEESQGTFKYSQEDIKKQLASKRYILWFDPSVLVQMSEFFKETGDLNRSLSLDEMFYGGFKEQLETAQIDIYGKN